MLNPKGRLPDGEFLSRFVSDYEVLERLGWKKGQIIRALCGTDYVRDWVMTPPWLEAVDRLPKGAKWSDGMRYGHKGGKKSASETYTLLAWDGDMYFRDLLNHMMAGHWKDADGNYIPNWEVPVTDGASAGYVTRTDHTICVVRGFRKLSSTEVVMGLRRGGMASPVLATAIKEAWRRNGGRIWPGECYGLREISEG